MPLSQSPAFVPDSSLPLPSSAAPSVASRPPAASVSVTRSVPLSDEEFARQLQADEERERAASRRSRQEEDERAFQALMVAEGTCAVCLQALGQDLVMEVDGCSHRVCSDCLRGALLSNDRPQCACPADHGRCSGVVPERHMRAVLSREELDAVQEKAMQAFLAQSSSSYVTCPACKETFEAVPSNVPTPTHAAAGGGGVGGAELDADGVPLSAAAVAHRGRFRFRCGSCSSNFCSGCSAVPYHLGYTCDEWKEYNEAVHCRYCECAMPAPPQPQPAPAGSTSTAALTSPVSAVNGVLARLTRSRKKEQPPPPPAPIKPSNVCGKAECQEKAAAACARVHACSHQCDGIRDERVCLPCLTASCSLNTSKTTREEFCSICWTETLGQAPCIQLSCTHVFHLSCMLTKLSKGWPSARITFYFLQCPLCNALVQHPALDAVLRPLLELREVVKKKAVERLVWEGCSNDAPLQKGGKYEGKREAYALDLFAYYQCFTCKQPYFGGRRHCEEAAGGGGADEKKWDPKELVCGGCVVVNDPSSAAAGCAKHGREFVEYKCRVSAGTCRSPLPLPPSAAVRTPLTPALSALPALAAV